MTYQTINPYTNTLVRSYPDAGNSDLEDALARGHALYKHWRGGQADLRSKILHGVARLMGEDRTRLSGLITMEMGKRISESQAEVDICISIADYFADHAEELLKPTTLETDTGHGHVVKQALGVLIMVEPWNFPYYQIMRVFAPNFILGNPMILKDASNIPACAQAFADIVERAGAPKGSLSNLRMDYGQVDKAIADRRVAGVALTGSERGGSSVARSAGEHLKKSTMELGGNDVFIVLDDADMSEVARLAPDARLGNTGQVCCASKRFIVMESKYDEFMDIMTEAFAKPKPGDPSDPATTLGPMSSVGARDNLQKQVDAAVDAGAHVAYGNERLDSPGAFFQPTVLTDIAPDNPVYDQEMFGPVAAVYKVESVREALDLANDSSYGLGSVIVSGDPERAERVAEGIETGMGFINGPWTTAPGLPFGGVKNSGFGRELYTYGFDAFANEHLILDESGR
ncbi:NAD-dependent succinate-semialdehyde dehydrogenase [Bifidobacterium xylocopae]|uniref:Succinate-semialdehyde dehydrogenase n=1 Tax=Bifidobacterium xylocopae TaxID=2493119 RepID=A0A366KF30_9BIFI|nr:NAD-dependent succinate-semialdehyde dehydrogenase [Bifidobacterium xylocopae]RBP99281.1 succinate-semialdehyde dehydrogenase [Bifidobacterium xylocopae]